MPEEGRGDGEVNKVSEEEVLKPQKKMSDYKIAVLDDILVEFYKK